MLLTAPAFLFLFLPLSFLLYSVLGKGRRRVSLLAICFAYHLALHLFHPYTLLAPILLIGYTYLGGLLIRRARRTALTVAVCLLPYIALIILRAIAYEEIVGFVYPVGLTVMTLGSTSYLADTVRERLPIPHRMSDLCLYLGFFSIMLAGPFVRYSEFFELTREDRLSFGVVDFADGARLFMVGLVKRIAVGAVLMEIYELFMHSLAQNSDALVTVLALIFVYFGVYFVITGYADMGCGLARMFGIRLRYVPTHPFRASLPEEYGRTVLGSFYEWLENYAVEPAVRVTKGRFACLIRAICYGGLFLLFIRFDWYVLLMVLPCVLITYFSLRFQWERRLKKRYGVRILTGFLTIMLTAFGWMCVTMGGMATVLKRFSQMSYLNSEYYLDKLLVSFSTVEFFCVFLVGVFLVAMPFCLRANSLRRHTKKRLVLEACGSLVLLIVFAFTLLFFLPQYGIYDTVPFRYVFI